MDVKGIVFNIMLNQSCKGRFLICRCFSWGLQQGMENFYKKKSSLKAL